MKRGGRKRNYQTIALDLLRLSFMHYQVWQNDEGDEDTFLDWIKDELEDWKKKKG